MKVFILWCFLNFGVFAIANNAEIAEKACMIGHNLKCFEAAELYLQQGNKEKAKQLFTKACEAKMAKACEKLKSLE